MPEGTGAKRTVGPVCDACMTASLSDAPIGMSAITYAGLHLVLCNNPVDCRLRAQRKAIWKVYNGQRIQ